MTSKITVLLALVLALALGACGGGDEDDAPAQEPVLSARQLEQAFLRGMVPHHESAVAMAEVAVGRAEHPEVKKLATAIVDDQMREIDQMRKIHERLFGSDLEPDEGAHTKLGLSVEEAGMDHMNAADSLREEDPFDRAFIDSMIPHHQGAVRMAKAVRAHAKDADVVELASSIIAAQEREIAQMRRWRERWYGSAQTDMSGMEGHQTPGH